jgi:hypothetical protein
LQFAKLVDFLGWKLENYGMQFNFDGFFGLENEVIWVAV